MTDIQPHIDETAVIERLRDELAKSEPSRRQRVVEKFILAALSSIPWVGGFLSAAAEYRAEEGSLRQDSLQTRWLEEHQAKLGALRDTLQEIQGRFDSLGPVIDERIQSDQYLGLVRKAFRVWDEADTAEKHRYVANVVTNAAGTRVCSDDVVRLFLDWLELYHEAHFAVVREIFKNPGVTRRHVVRSLWRHTSRGFGRGGPIQASCPRSKYGRRHKAGARRQSTRAVH